MQGKRFAVPAGVVRLPVVAYATQRKLFSCIENLFDRWGYLPIFTPMIDFFSVYEQLLIPEEVATSYRLFDRNGEVLILRSDITLFVVKQIAMQLTKEALPLRICYSDEIIRLTDEVIRSETRQSGAELVGVEGIDGDMEILLLLFETLDAAGGGDTVVHLGSREFLLHCAEECNLPEEDLVEAVYRRNRLAVDSLLQHQSSSRRKALSEIFFFMGDRTNFTILCQQYSSVLTPKEQNSLEYLRSLMQLCESTDWGQRVRIDISEVGVHSYYTGIVYSAYNVLVEQAVASGGRYDTLFSHFGPSVPALGFSFFPLKLLKENAMFSSRPAPGKDILTRYEQAKKMREKGERVTL